MQDCQIEIPPSFIAIFQRHPCVPIPSHRWTEILAKYEICEDLAHLLAQQGRAAMLDMGITEFDVQTTYRSHLAAPEMALTEKEQAWVLLRCCEVAQWLMPDDLMQIVTQSSGNATRAASLDNNHGQT